MDEQLHQLATFLQDAPRTLRATLTGEAFNCYLLDAFESNKLDYALSTLMAAKDEFLKLNLSVESSDPRPPKWIDYNEPLVHESVLLGIIMEWKKEHTVYNFEALRCYVLAHCFQPKSSHPEDIEVGEYLTRAFNYTDYKGDNARRFNSFICESLRNFDPESYYGSTIPILQSSGTGKSRLASEMRNFWPTLSVCLRDPNALFASGYPLGDRPAAQFFIEEAAMKRPNITVMAFLSAWLDIAYQGLNPMELDAPMKEIMAAWDLVPSPTTQASGSRLPSSSLLPSLPSSSSLSSLPSSSSLSSLPSSSSFSVPMNANRTRLFEKIVASARERITKWNKASSKKRETSHEEYEKEMARYFLAEPMKNLGDLLTKFKAVQQQQTNFDLEKPLVCLVVDECSFLNVKPSTDSEGVQALRRAMFLVDAAGIKAPVRYVLLLLDTNSSILKMLPFGEQITSERETALKRLEPWNFLGFDVMARKQTPLALPRDVLGLDHLCNYGRPLWSSYPTSKVLKNAGIKLFPSSFSPSQEQHVLACLSARVGVDFLPLRSGQSGFAMAVKAVDSSMRLLKRLETFSTTIITMAPSEPLLALASWVVLTQDNNYSEVLTKFKTDLLIKGFIELQGGLGEFVSRLLIVMARDAAVQTHLPQAEQQLEQTAISVEKFLSQMIDCKNMKKLFSPMGSDFLRSGMINVTHVGTVNLSLPAPIDARLLWTYWKRGLAIQCVHGQPGIDGIIPVYVGDLDTPLCSNIKNPSLAETYEDASRKMSYIGWQAKNRSRGVSISEGAQGPNVIGGYQSTALFTILLELGTETPFQRAPRSRTNPYYVVSTLKIPKDTEATGPPQKRTRGEGSSTATSRETSQSFPVLCIRGIQRTFPCLDVWKSRPIVSEILNSTRPLESMELEADIMMCTIDTGKPE